MFQNILWGWLRYNVFCRIPNRHFQCVFLISESRCTVIKTREVSVVDFLNFLRITSLETPGIIFYLILWKYFIQYFLHYFHKTQLCVKSILQRNHTWQLSAFWKKNKTKINFFPAEVLNEVSWNYVKIPFN